MDIAIGCGVESMSRVPMFSDGRFSPEFIADFPYGIVHQGISAEMLVDKWGLSREALDEYALQTHCRAAAARAGWSQREMTPVGEIRTDQGVRANPDPARLAALPGVFRPNGAITAGNSSQISDGAAAVLLASGQKAGSVAKTVEISNRAGLAVRVNYSARNPSVSWMNKTRPTTSPLGNHLTWPFRIMCTAS